MASTSVLLSTGSILSGLQAAGHGFQFDFFAGCPSPGARRPSKPCRPACLPPWHVGQLPEPPHPGWRLWIGLVGPGVVLAGTSIGSGEWLFGPAVTAQYGADVSLAGHDQHRPAGLLQPDDDALHALLRRTDHRRRHAHLARARWAGSASMALLDLVGGIWPYNAAAAAGPVGRRHSRPPAGSGQPDACWATS